MFTVITCVHWLLHEINHSHLWAAGAIAGEEMKFWHRRSTALHEHALCAVLLEENKY